MAGTEKSGVKLARIDAALSRRAVEVVCLSFRDVVKGLDVSGPRLLSYRRGEAPVPEDVRHQLADFMERRAAVLRGVAGEIVADMAKHRNGIVLDR